MWKPTRAIVAVVVALAVVLAFSYAARRLTATDRARLNDAWANAQQRAITGDVSDTTPSDYYLDMSRIVGLTRSGFYSKPAFDASGVPIFDAAKLRYGTAGTYNPVNVAQYALGIRQESEGAGGEATRAAFLVQARWLAGRVSADGRIFYDFPVPSRGIKAPWASAMAQGQAISVLVRAYADTGDRTFLDAAKQAYLPFTRDVQHDGVVIRDGDDLWLEEYVETPPSHVLNGSIFALFGVWDLYRVTRDPGVRDTFDRATATVSRHLPDYEQDGWVLYQLKGDAFAKGVYYPLHIAQLRGLAAITGQARFGEVADKWERPLLHPWWFLADRLVPRAGAKAAQLAERLRSHL